METPADVTGPMNLGNPRELTIRDLAEMVLAKTGSAVPLIFKPLPQDDPVQRRPDISFAKEVIGWEPKIGLEQGLDATIAYFSEKLQGPTDGEAAQGGGRTRGV